MAKSIEFLSRYEVLSLPVTPEVYIVLSDNLSAWLSQQVKKHTHGYYSHAMLMRKTGWVVSQDRVYREVGVHKYVDSDHRLKIIRMLNVTPEQLREQQLRIRERLALPWYKRRYDYLGILGQKLNIRWLQRGSLNFCSEDVVQHMSLGDCLIGSLPKHPSPEDLNRYTKAHQEKYKVVGYYDPNICR